MGRGRESNRVNGTGAASRAASPRAWPRAHGPRGVAADSGMRDEGSPRSPPETRPAHRTALLVSPRAHGRWAPGPSFATSTSFTARDLWECSVSGCGLGSAVPSIRQRLHSRCCGQLAACCLPSGCSWLLLAAPSCSHSRSPPIGAGEPAELRMFHLARPGRLETSWPIARPARPPSSMSHQLGPCWGLSGPHGGRHAATPQEASSRWGDLCP